MLRIIIGGIFVFCASCSSEGVSDSQVCRYNVIVEIDWYNENIQEYRDIVSSISADYLESRIGVAPVLLDNSYSFSDRCDGGAYISRFKNIPRVVTIDYEVATD